ncbi:MAG: hypothetical protein GF364_05800 [Candidatus Lokiarchaeota archaeon]|nr:hypothetical protein [Candidatus Lokiarchaeota archaeon]
MNNRIQSEGFKLARLFMVLASLSPLFLLWMVKGIPTVPDYILVPICIGLIFLPNLVLLARLKIALNRSDKYTKSIGTVEDHRDHLLVYLFAILLPFWEAGLSNPRELASMIIALGFIIFLFWHLNLHYMNVIFAVFGYRVFSVHRIANDGGYATADVFIIITRRPFLNKGQEIEAYRISNQVYWERS